MSVVASLAEVLRTHLTGATIAASDGGPLDIRVGQGPRARSIQVAVDALTARFDGAADAQEQRADLLAFARGVAAVLAEPAHGKGAEMEFNAAARGVLPLLERPAFADGARAAGREPALQRWADGLELAFSLELDDGYRLLPVEQMRTWGVTDDRLERAAFSILFHQSRYVELTPWDGHDALDAYAGGDGHDPARAILLDSVDYDRCRRGVFFAMPTTGLLLVTRGPDGPSEAQFRAVVESVFAQSERPFSRALHRFVDGRRIAYT
jgi:hypothetical protein